MRLAEPSVTLALLLLLPLSPPLIATPVASVLPAAFNFDTAFGRLPKNVVPLDYTLRSHPSSSPIP